MFAPFRNTKGVAGAMVDFGLSEARGGRPARPGPPRLVADNRLSGGFAAFDVAELSLDQIDAAQGEWTSLAARALEPNAFFEPGFALAAALHFPPKARPVFIVVWSRQPGGGRRMMGLFPITPANPLTGDGFIRLWLHKQAALATPLVDREKAVEVLEAFLDWLEARSFARGIVFSRTTADGRFHAALADAARRKGRRMEILDSYERAALFAGGDADAVLARGSRKRLNEIGRLRRRLAEMGRVDFDFAATPEEVRGATEEFLALEASGWKAGRGALLSQASLTTFLRSATRLLAREGRCKIHALRLEGRPIAMGVLIESQRRNYYWKIAFDENFRSLGPGVQLVHEQTRLLLSRPEVELTDSCAIANHPMIDRLWPDRIGVCDLAVQLQSGREGDFLAGCRRDLGRRRLRDLAKRAANRLLRRKVS
ncbi:GNAT family N-acetyltransferase [Methylocystis sp. ATCC 49242]|uniref:GNAT family N-acetyltransferase n=1 Tax=Methylocystis sp. ATCC 49242 TaxID=622637 RepID=UPI0001F86E90|nr:GNAT family N-acetyltransferase [Methylocystis sp. ATCC 49242]